ncbi:MAG: M42 family metallopeptidase [Bacillota bacterium]|nr:M42 family metallopeptidase [Bacillota bacterium]
MLKRLTNAFGPSGCEDEVREIVLKEIRPFCDSITIDKMGNVIAFKKGRDSSKKFMADAHMDEVGLIVKTVTEDGYLKFDEVGGIDSRLLLGKRVFVGEKRTPGVIGIKAVHLTTKEERTTVLKIKDMYIDIGCTSRDEALEFAAKGDFIVFDSDYVEFGEDMIKAKALDDRAGVAILIELLKAAPAYDFYAVFSVQEEIGLLGAKVAANAIRPDYALIVESTICADICDVEEHLQVTKIGSGPVLSVMERTSSATVEMRGFIEKIAESEGIPYQYKRSGSGGNNAGSVQIAGGGVQTATLSVPCRYLHSPGCVISRGDFEKAKKLAVAICERMDEICLKN